jgi:hypothetical protein
MSFLSRVKAYAEQHLQSLDASLHQHIQAFISRIESTETLIANEVSHLEGLGYKVVHPDDVPTLQFPPVQNS